jgi:hypothetical protein
MARNEEIEIEAILEFKVYKCSKNLSVQIDQKSFS